MPKVTIIIDANDIDELHQSDEECGTIETQISLQINGTLPAIVMALQDAIEKEPNLANIFMSAAMTYAANDAARQMKEERKVKKIKLSNSDLN